jgi:hypothetical protein
VALGSGVARGLRLVKGGGPTELVPLGRDGGRRRHRARSRTARSQAARSQAGRAQVGKSQTARSQTARSAAGKGKALPVRSSPRSDGGPELRRLASGEGAPR